MKPTIFIVDGNYYLHRAYAVTRAVHRDFSIALSSLYIGMICKDMAAVRAKKLLICFDGPAVFRFELWPYYKANRREAHTAVDNTAPGREGAKEIYTYLDGIKALLTEIGMPFVQYDKYEADDCCCSAAAQYKDSYNVVIGTKDKDSYQYLDTDVSLYDSSYKVHGEAKPRYITANMVKELKGVEPSEMRTLQALTGDAIDNIPEILGPRQAKLLIKKYGTIKNAMAKDKEYHDMLLPKLEELKRNAKLVTLIKDVKLPKAADLIVKKAVLDEELKNNLPKAYFNLIDYLYPKTNSLF